MECFWMKAVCDSEEQRLLIRRVINETGSRAFVNNSPVTAAYLRDLGEYLIDIHGPNDSQTSAAKTTAYTARLLPVMPTVRGMPASLESIAGVRQERQALQEDNLSAEKSSCSYFNCRRSTGPKFG